MNRRHGITVTDVLLVLVILAFLVGVIIPVIIGIAHRAAQNRAADRATTDTGASTKPGQSTGPNVVVAADG
jgi:type II secretory pathway pseudopilin PulG